MFSAMPECRRNQHASVTLRWNCRPGNYAFRSCAWRFMELGRTQRAMDFVRLDAGSEWAAFVMPSVLLREGKVAEARESVKKISTIPSIIEICSRHASACGQLPSWTKSRPSAETAVLAEPDPEPWY